jgi:hypothetical protein
MGLAGLGSGQAKLGSAWDGVGLFRLDLIGLSELYGYGQGSIYLVLLGPCSLPVQLGLCGTYCLSRSPYSSGLAAHASLRKAI